MSLTPLELKELADFVYEISVAECTEVVARNCGVWCDDAGKVGPSERLPIFADILLAVADGFRERAKAQGRTVADEQ